MTVLQARWLCGRRSQRSRGSRPFSGQRGQILLGHSRRRQDRILRQRLDAEDGFDRARRAEAVAVMDFVELTDGAAPSKSVCSDRNSAASFLAVPVPWALM